MGGLVETLLSDLAVLAPSWVSDDSDVEELEFQHDSERTGGEVDEVYDLIAPFGLDCCRPRRVALLELVAHPVERVVTRMGRQKGSSESSEMLGDDVSE